ncbi:inactive peptidyl-prolyl cis-trans isomerase shutdown [Drosophila kikkawai]|uniref:peptidylprolyl isomerase n=1 Tax=Drosophila kikkawai TaxID=30033 RepID=A0A6P4IYB3_DROKI|nr:inactive peptidyl-prolyl cis-trans isomerase shutdown [Drosophila kikkawai]
METLSSAPQLLREPVSFAQLVDKGVEFEMDEAQFKYDEDSDEFEDCEEDSQGTEALRSPWLHPFDELRALMQPIGEHIFKRIIRQGHVDRDPVPDKARVSMRYSGYWEGVGAPFDSSLLRGTKYEFETGTNTVLEGLEAAVRTMRPYEQAEFIISYKLLFRELGCPPRIKPMADGLFKIEVIDYTLIGDGQAMENIPKEDCDKFCVVYPKAQDLHLYGKDCVKRSRFRCAVTAFERALDSLNYCRLANEEEERQQTALLLTLSQNLMVCFNKLGQPRRVCIAMKDVRRLTNNDPSCKALFHEARALTALGEYKRARTILMQAHAKQPTNAEINEEIKLLENRITKYEESSRDLWSRALWGKKAKENLPVSETKGNSAKEAKFKQELEELIKQFESSERFSIGLSRHVYSEGMLEVLSDMAKDHNMKLNYSPIHEDLVTLSKEEK